MRLAPLLLLPVWVLLASPLYRVVDLGPSAATAINASGATVGWRVDQSQSVYATASARALGGAHQSHAYGINDAGDAVGIRFDELGNTLAVVWQADGSVTELGGAESYALGINQAGVAAGSVSGHAVRFTRAGPAAIPVKAAWSAAYDINFSGTVAGTAQLATGAFRAFTASASNSVTILGTLGGLSSYGQAINASGWVAGGSLTARGYLHAFLNTGGRLQDLGTLRGGANSSAYGVSDAGLVVGFSQTEDGEQSAFLWDSGSMRDLNELIACDSGWRLLEASAINNRGQIAGYGLAGGQRRAFRLDPLELAASTADVPEPSAPTMLAMGLAGVACWGVRRLSSPTSGADRPGSPPPCR